MPCSSCDHDRADHDEYEKKCSRCDCTSYVESMFECNQCGASFGETQARQGHDLCEGCAKEHNDGKVTWD